jgi:amidase/aspartyl-tRNA(Asn)/glutamyl-tRNA(Gln) amidotransferase subunit A
MSLPRGAGDKSGIDVHAAREALQSGASTACDLLDAALAAAEGSPAQHAFIRRFDAQARAAAGAVDAARAAGSPLPSLAGLAVSIKDLFDVAGWPTTAGSRALQGSPPAVADAPVVARLRRAGAALVGHTNMSEFAFSGVGINPHFGTPANAATATLDPTPRIPGGSSSGAAVSVACGAAWAALGSDTGGSIRIPAALQGLVGFKNTQRLTPLQGSVPLSPTLDTACAITRSVRDAVLLHEVLAARSVRLMQQPLHRLRLAVPLTLMLDGLEPAVAAAFERALSRLRAAGARIEDLALPQLAQLATLNAHGGFAGAEAWAWHRHRLAEHGESYDPRVALRIRRGASVSAAEHIDLIQARAAWITSVEAALAGFDALLSPTVPMLAPPLAPLIADDDAFFAVNARLLRNPSAVNFLDGCAISLPCQPEGEAPVGLMVWGAAMADDTVLDVALAIERELGRPVPGGGL